MKNMQELLTKKMAVAALAVILAIPAEVLRPSGEEILLVLLLFFIVVIDSLTGVASACKNKVLASSRMAQPMTKKVLLYSAAIFTVYIISRSHPLLSWSLSYMIIYLILSEALSIFENLSLLGFRVPTKILSSVNRLFEKYENGDEGAKKKILDKEVL